MCETFFIHSRIFNFKKGGQNEKNLFRSQSLEKETAIKYLLYPQAARTHSHSLTSANTHVIHSYTCTSPHTHTHTRLSFISSQNQLAPSVHMLKTFLWSESVHKRLKIAAAAADTADAADVQPSHRHRPAGTTSLPHRSLAGPVRSFSTPSPFCALI